jgi:bifunctional non-homologous end joining protein LigD
MRQRLPRMPSRAPIARDTSLRTYRAKRNFGVTPEPAPGRAKPGKTLRFVVHKHAASHLHWDFRLEHGGVLWSWAVPKEPSLDPADKRLAVRVEDHPLTYADFEGRIPAGNYGAGSVEIWDSGSWQPEGDPEAGLAAGELKFTLKGKRLSGGFVLVQLRRGGRKGAENWLLIKERDAAAQAGGNASLLEGGKASEPRSTTRRKPASAQSKPAKAAAKAEAPPLTHADRELWPGITKQDLAEYWRKVAPRALPEIARRPLALVRCPYGIDGQRFFQKHAGKGLPAAIRAGELQEGPYLAIEDEAGLIACVQIAAIELHGWGATLDDPTHPDRMVFDLDPGEGVDFAEVVRAALEVRQRLKAAGLESFCRTTGGKGLHVVVPLDGRADWEAVRDFARALAQRMEAEAPERFVSTVPKAKRQGRILVDWLRNGPGATAICSYCPRARSNATVATPLAWREVNTKLDPQAFTIASLPGRVARQKQDPWASLVTLH